MIYRLPRPFKRGDTFRLPFNVTGPDGTAEDISNWIIVSKLRDSQGQEVHSFASEWITDGTDGRAALIAAPADTYGWALGYHMMDIRVENTSGAVYSTATIQVYVTEGPSYG